MPGLKHDLKMRAEEPNEVTFDPLKCITSWLRNLKGRPWFLSQEHECGGQHTLARQTIPLLTLLKGTVKAVNESVGCLQREVFQTSS